MSPLGKLTLAVIGLRFFGADGFFAGLFLGHMLIDKTFVIRRLEEEVNHLDDMIRIKLPYKIYRYYNRIDGNVWGKLWGAILGGVLFGLGGLIVMFFVGQVVFDMPENSEIRRAKKNVDHFFDNNWGKILGAVLGFILHSMVLLFVGLIVGAMADFQRLDEGRLLPFRMVSDWFQKINPLKLWRHADSGEHRDYLEIMAALAARAVEAGGKISKDKRVAFEQVFAVKPDRESKLRDIFTDADKHKNSVKIYAMRLEKITRGNAELEESSMESLFRVVTAGGILKDESVKVLAEVAEIIGLDNAVFDKLKKHFTPLKIDKNIKQWSEVLGVLPEASLDEIKRQWKKLILLNHPDKLGNVSEAKLKNATEKMAKINLAYQELVKAKSKK